MLILMKSDHKEEELEQVLLQIKKMGFKSHVIPGKHSLAVGITGNLISPDPQEFLALKGVQDAISVSKPFKLASRDFHPNETLIQVGDVTFGGDNFVLIGGPCAVESEEQTLRIAKAVKEAGANVLRGGAFKPRTSPYSFQGLELEGLKILAKAREETGLPVISEALDLRSLEMVNEYSDIIQIGTRNMQNFSLLKACGKADKPVMIKRGFSATIDEWLLAAEYVMHHGNKNVILCERGLRSFDKYTRNLLDLGAVSVAKELSHLPVMVDPSHSTGRRNHVVPLSKAALAVGAHSIIVDVHDRPDEALCDGAHALSFEVFSNLSRDLKKIAGVMDIKIK